VNMIVILLIGLYVLFLTLIGLVVAYHPVRNLICMSRTPALSIGAIKDEKKVQVEGRVTSADAESPFRKTRCAIWDASAEKWSGGRGQYWIKIWSAHSTASFNISDGTAAILAVPKGGDRDLRKDWQEENYGVSLDPRTKAALAGLKISTKGFMGADIKLRLKEGCLSVGDPVYVLGKVGQVEGQKAIIAHRAGCFLISRQDRAGLRASLYRDLGLRLAGTYGAGLFFVIVLIVLFFIIQG
jgi:hypothetical protein